MNMQEERFQSVYKNANSLRVHQDNLRWTISAGYFAFIAAAPSSIEKILPNINPAVSFALLWLASLCFLLILAIESWYYNLFSDYVKACERRFVKLEGLQELSEFGSDKGKSITPFHSSFIFVLGFVAVSNAYFLHRFLCQLGFNNYVERAVVIAVFLSYAVCCRYWNKIVYRYLISKLDSFFSPRGVND